MCGCRRTRISPSLQFEATITKAWAGWFLTFALPPPRSRSQDVFFNSRCDGKNYKTKLLHALSTSSGDASASLSRQQGCRHSRTWRISSSAMHADSRRNRALRELRGNRALLTHEHQRLAEGDIPALHGGLPGKGRRGQAHGALGSRTAPRS